MNVELLKKVQSTILEEPKRLNMDRWWDTQESTVQLLCGGKEHMPPCGTIGCIAGWATHLAGKDSDWPNLQAMDVLGLEYFQGEALFYPGNWPFDLQNELQQLKPGTLPYAQVVAKAIDRFIEAGGPTVGEEW